MHLNLLNEFLLIFCAVFLMSANSLNDHSLNNTIFMYTNDGQCTFKEYNPTKVLHLDPNVDQRISANGLRSAKSKICTVTFAIKSNEKLKLSMDFLEIQTCNMTASLYLLLERNKLEKRKEFNCNTTYDHKPIYLHGGPHYYGILEINKVHFHDTKFILRAKVTIIPDLITTTHWPTTLIKGQSSTKQTSLDPSSHTLLLAIGIVIPLILLVASAFTYHVWHRGQQRLGNVNSSSFTFSRILRQRRDARRNTQRNQSQSTQQRSHIRTIGDLYGDPFDFLAWEEFFGCFSSMDFPKPVELPPYPGYDSPPPYESVVNETQGLETIIQPPPPPAPAPSVHQLRHQSTMVAMHSDSETVRSPSGMETTV